MEAENLLVKGVFPGGVADHEAGVDDAVRGGVRGRRGGVVRGLNEEDAIALGILDAEGAVLERLGNGYALFGQVFGEGRGVAGGEGDGVEPGLRCGRGQRLYLDPLDVTDGVARDGTLGGAGEAEGVFVEGLGGFRMLGIEAEEGDAGDSGPLLREAGQSCDEE